MKSVKKDSKITPEEVLDVAGGVWDKVNRTRALLWGLGASAVTSCLDIVLTGATDPKTALTAGALGALASVGCNMSDDGKPLPLK